MTDLKGGPELMAFLESLPAKLANNALRGGLRAAARTVADEAIELTNSHEIKEGIKVSSGVRNGLIYSKVKLTGFAASIGIWAEFGTAAHLIFRRAPGSNSKSKSVADKRKGGTLKIGEDFVGPMISHPGADEHPFLRRALDNKHADAVNAMGGYIAARMEKGGLDAPDFGVDDEVEE